MSGVRGDGEQISVDRLPEAGSSLEVVLLRDARYGSDSDGPRRRHRHDYHELVWTRCGTGRHLIDGDVSLVEPNTITLIGRGQVHVFERARGLHGAIVRFGDELLHGDPAGAANPAWLIGSRAVPTVEVPAGEVGRLEAAIELLAAEAPPVFGHADGNLANHLWDGRRVALVDFEDAGRSDRAFELADAAEHVSMRLGAGVDAQAFLARFDLSPAEHVRLNGFRRLFGLFWLLMLLPSSPGHRRNPPGTLERQADRLFLLLG